MDEVPGSKPAAGITRVNLEKGDYGAGGVSVPETMANTGMDTAYPVEGRRRNLNGPNNR